MSLEAFHYCCFFELIIVFRDMLTCTYIHIGIEQAIIDLFNKKINNYYNKFVAAGVVQHSIFVHFVCSAYTAFCVFCVFVIL